MVTIRILMLLRAWLFCLKGLDIYFVIVVELNDFRLSFFCSFCALSFFQAFGTNKPKENQRTQVKRGVQKEKKMRKSLALSKWSFASFRCHHLSHPLLLHFFSFHCWAPAEFQLYFSISHFPPSHAMEGYGLEGRYYEDIHSSEVLSFFLAKGLAL